MMFLSWLFGCPHCEKKDSEVSRLENLLQTQHCRVNAQFEELDVLRARTKTLELALVSAVENPMYRAMHLRISNQRREIATMLALYKVRCRQELELIRECEALKKEKSDRS